jgi:hypothetical protein
MIFLLYFLQFIGLDAHLLRPQIYYFNVNSFWNITLNITVQTFGLYKRTF